MNLILGLSPFWILRTGITGAAFIASFLLTVCFRRWWLSTLVGLAAAGAALLLWFDTEALTLGGLLYLPAAICGGLMGGFLRWGLEELRNRRGVSR